MLFCFTSSHRTAGFNLLERLERNASAVTAALREQDDLVSGSVVLATCNRFETYLDLDEAALARRGADTGALIDLVSDAAGVDADELRDGSETFTADAVAGHLFAVSSGLESVVVGEGEIAGQVRRAFASARKDGRVTGDLERLFRDASRTSRDVKNGTGLTTAGRSMVRLALDLAASRFADWSRHGVLLVGTGRYAAVSLAAVRERGVGDVTVFSRSGRAEAFALKHGIAAVPADGLEEAVASADLVIACSVAPNVILDAETVRRATERRAGRPLLVIDLGLPRNVEQTVAVLPGVELLDLETISIHAPLAELNAADEARALVSSAAAEFTARSAERTVEPALVALRQHVLAVLESEVARNAKRDAEGEIERALRHLAGVLLHTPSVRARELARGGGAEAFAAGVEAVFGVLPAPAAESAIEDAASA